MKKTLCFSILILFASIYSFGQNGFIDLKSEPKGATIFIDQKLKGQTPAILELSPGKHKIKLELDGYETSTTNVEIVSDLVLNETIRLRALGKLSITTNPQNSNIYIDGEYKGKAPGKFENLTNGDYEITLKAYLDDPYFEEFEISKRITVSPKKTTKLDINFYDQFKLGNLSLKSNISNTFNVSRIENNYKKAIQTKDSENLISTTQLLTGTYNLQWTDTKTNTTQFDIFDDKITSVFAPVKKIYKKEYNLSDMPNYQSKDNYVSSNYKPRPERKGKKGSAVYYLSGGGLGGMIISGGPEKNKGLFIASAASLAASFIWYFIEDGRANKKLKSTIKNNSEQRKRVNDDYEVLLNQLRIERDKKNKRIEEENKKIKEYNNSLPSVEVKYESK
ncbi:PEGA domain-containing protein [uncultured Draconibacterium sp.]|uniref:PEGA domain-containing protein n=1 Tax=uncultured Draconibacterium sp. TaxID=1573823 RepID=UPI003260B23C